MTNNNFYLKGNELENEFSNEENSKKITSDKNNLLDDFSDILYTPNDKIEDIFQEVYFSDIPCSQMNIEMKQEKVNNDLNKKKILSLSCKNNIIEKEKKESHITNTNSSRRIQRISIFNNNNNNNNEYNSFSNRKRKKNSNETTSFIKIPEECNFVSQNNAIKKEKEQNIPHHYNDNTNNKNKFSSNYQKNTNTIHHIKHISMFNNKNNTNGNNIINSIKNNDINNNKISSNDLQKNEKETTEKDNPPPQHVYIQEDKSTKVITETQTSLNTAKRFKHNNSNNSINNNIDKYFVHTKNNINHDTSKNSNSETVYLKKNSDVKDFTFSHSFHLSQASSDEDVDVEKINFNFSSIMYDNPSTGAMKSCIGYLDPDYIKNGNNNNKKETRIKGLKPFMDNREYKIGQQSTESQVSNIFKGVVVYINGFSRNCTDVELKRLVRIHGGKVCWYGSKTRVTHVICSSLCESKIQNYLSSKVNHYKMVTDQWIIDSIKANKRLSETPYLTLNALKKAQYQRNLFDYIKK